MASVQRNKLRGLRDKGPVGTSPENPSGRGWGYLVIWQFQVRRGSERRFGRAYGAEGDWARLFSQDESYLGTDLIRDLKRKRIYMTLDFWTSEKAYHAFRKHHEVKYKALDKKCEAMTESEREVGRFRRVPS